MKNYSINFRKMAAAVMALAFAFTVTTGAYAAPMPQQDSMKKEKKAGKKGMKMEKKKMKKEGMKKDSMGN